MVGNFEDQSSIWINSNLEIVWNAIIDQDKLSKWYAPGSPWEISSLSVGEEMTFTLMPSTHNHLTEKVTMILTIESNKFLEEFTFSLATPKTLISIKLKEEERGARVTMNSEGFTPSLENLKALVEGHKIPNV